MPSEENNNENTGNQKCGFITVIGLPNAGKSTLINNIVGSKVSIVTQKVQTTRTKVLGIVVKGETQIVLVDTPGIFSPKKTLEKSMVKAATDSIDDGDFVLHIVDVNKKNLLEENQRIIKLLEGRKNVLLALNKIDKIDKEKLLEITVQLNEAFPYLETFMISALKGKGVEKITEYLRQNLPDGVWLFPEDQMSDMPLRLMAAEITREKIFRQLHQELPYSIMVETEKWENFEDGSVKISQVVYVEKDSQKAIVLGKGGSRIKEIGKQSRMDLTELLDTNVHLKIFVKVQERWSEHPDTYKKIGLEFLG